MGPGERLDDGINVERPSAGRIYDYLLGGAHNFAADRRVAERVLTAFPGAPLAAHANRGFVRRAVRFLCEAGVRQFLDVGSGIPTVGHVHEVAQAAAPEARVVYVDTDPVAVAHSREVVAGTGGTAVLREDLRRPERILDHPDVRRLLDFDQPVGVLLVAVLHFVGDTDAPADIVARLTAPLVAGSHLVMSHATTEAVPEVAHLTGIYRSAGLTLVPRDRAQVRALMAGFDLVAPGIVDVARWRPDDGEGDAGASGTGAAGAYHAAVGRRR